MFNKQAVNKLEPLTSFPRDRLDRVAGDRALDIQVAPSHGGNFGHLSDVRQAIHVDSGRVECFPRSVGCYAGVLPAVLLGHSTDVQMAHYVVLQRHVLPHYEPKCRIMLVSEFRKKGFATVIFKIPKIWVMKSG